MRNIVGEFADQFFEFPGILTGNAEDLAYKKEVE